jgi:hypothetical protein
VQPIQSRPSAEIPVFSNEPEGNVVDARNPDSVLFKVTEVAAAETSARAGQPKVGSGLIDVRSLVGESEAAVAPTGSLVDEVRANAPAVEGDELGAPPSRWIWWVMAVLIAAVIGLAIKVLGLV